MSRIATPSPLLPRRAVLAGSLAAVAGAPPALGAPATFPDGLPTALRDVIALCKRADNAVWAEIRSEGEPGYAAACEAARALELEIERLRTRVLARSPKTWEDVAVLAVIALYWDRGELEHLVESAGQLDDPDNILIGCAARAMPSVFLAVLEVLGINRDTFSATEAA